ncbi:dihydrodipicolinate synthase family protein [Kutzneria sp. NPDC051319]|uniref:dihydrodipicolinate synthase family protein n=1 Tax=Kutzneria sp. NPDC051319 TaxID=3155047 RepID=UPI003445EE70
MNSRVIFAAAHVVADPDDNTTVDWDATMAFRRHLWRLGLGVAEAMDTAQRGMGLNWATAAELIRRSAADAAAGGGLIACGAGTDQLTEPPSTLDEVIAAYTEQLSVVEAAGAQPILMASRQLAALARDADDYHEVYGWLLGQLSDKAILHWLGPMFDPALAGYWGSEDLDKATETFLSVIEANAERIDGVKISLLDAEREIQLRRRLPQGVRCYTGDDFNYPRLITGDEHGHSDALLGVFDPLAVVAEQAMGRLDDGDTEGFLARLEPTVALARHVFETPTRFYKTGVVFLAWLGGHQDHFSMIGGLETARSREHLVRCYELAAELDLFADPELAASRVASL